MSYKVFLKAPTAAVLKKKAPEDAFRWQTAESLAEKSHFTQDIDDDTSSSKSKAIEESPSQVTAEVEDSQEWILPPATLGAASQRISEMYKNVIFAEDDDDEENWEGHIGTREDQSGWEDSRAVSKEGTLISWPPTNPEQSRSRASLSRARTGSQLETQDCSTDTSYAHTSTSSITAFPTFVINLHTLTSLSTLAAAPAQEVKWSCKVHLLVAVLEADGPDAVRVKKGPDAGKEIGVLKLVIGDDEGGLCKLTAWRGVADAWGGAREVEPDESMGENEGVKRGDIVYLENILASSSQSDAAQPGQRLIQAGVALTASPNLASRLHICYRTLPTVPSDRRFRPDLRLAASDPGLRKVAGVVRWLQGVMGLEPS